MRFDPLKFSILCLVLNGCFPFGDNDESSHTQPIFSVDSNTVSYFKFDEYGDTLNDNASGMKGLLIGATRAAGYQGNGVLLGLNAYVRLDSLIPDGTMNGTIELYVKPGTLFDTSLTFSLVGDQGARCNLFYRHSNLYFFKNFTGQAKSIGATFTPARNVWYKLAATWGAKGMRLFVNDSLVASNLDSTRYEMDRISGTGYNILYLGYKNEAGLINIGLPGTPATYYFEGVMDELRVSRIERY